MVSGHAIQYVMGIMVWYGMEPYGMGQYTQKSKAISLWGGGGGLILE